MNEQTVQIAEIKRLTPRIKSFRLVSANGKKLAPFSPGSHVAVTIPVELKTLHNSYSLCSSPYERNFYEIAVLLTKNSRGGSQYLHQITTEKKLKISLPKNSFALTSRARKYILIAGGIGITPLLSMLATLSRFQTTFELHYAAKSQTECAFYDFLQQQYICKITGQSRFRENLSTPTQVRFYFSELGDYMSPKEILKEQPLGTHVYLCAPSSLREDFLSAARALGYPSSAIHRELFGAIKTKKIEPFTAVLAKLKQEIKVTKDQTLLEALEAAKIPVSYSCRAGGCGACEIKVLAGEIDHLDNYYSAEERAEQDRILACISRAKSRQLVIDL